jgi:plasmid stability protein
MLASSGDPVATILVRNVDEWVITRLKELAKENGRSMEAEVRALLAEAAKPDENLTGPALVTFLTSGPKPDDDDWDISVPDDHSMPPNPFEER